MVTAKNNKTASDTVFELIIQPSGVAQLIIDDKSESVNTLKANVAEQILTLLKTIKNDQAIKGLIIVSGKKDSFIAGADINMLAACNTKEEAVALSRQGQMVFDVIEKLSIPTVAAIHGACLGGGLELALACDHRICSDSDKTSLGLPEVQLGLLPGGGGTQRLPRLVGIQKALDMILTGKQLRAKQALKIGLVQDVVADNILLATAEKLIFTVINSGFCPCAKARLRNASLFTKITDKFLEGTALGRKIIFQQAKKTVLAKTKGNYPAPLNIIKCVQAGVEQACAKGYQIEAELFAELVVSKESEQLRHIFFATTEMKKEQGIADVPAKAINQVAVLGGGLMGGGIAFVTASKANLPVRIKDISAKGINAALKYSYGLLITKVKRRFISHSEMQSQLAKITGTIDYSGFKRVDLVIEAVFEDLALKQNMVKDIEQHCSPETIFASNTSSLPIAQIAANAQRPENVIGLHYFSPVDKMPLAEIIAHQKTSDQTISTTVAFAKKQGKTAIVVKDTAGFYVNRILAPYMNEAANILLSGQRIEHIDKALVKFGFPVGPMQLLDEVGIDIGAKIGPVLQQELGSRFTPPSAFNKLISDGRLGKKAKKGLYLYGNKKSNKRVADENVYTLLNVELSAQTDTDIAVRCVYMMLNEAARCLAEGVIRSPRDGDIGAIFGIGFPPFLGGPFRYMDSLGIQHVVQQLNYYAHNVSINFKPCQALNDMAEKGLKYYPELRLNRK